VRPGSLFGLAANLGLGGCNFQDFFRKTSIFSDFGFRISMAWRGGVAAPDAEVLDSGWNFSRSWGSASDTRYARYARYARSQGVENDSK